MNPGGLAIITFRGAASAKALPFRNLLKRWAGFNLPHAPSRPA